MNNQSYILQLWQDYKQKFAVPHMQMLQSGQLSLNNKTMRFIYKKKGKRPTNGYTLIFGLHGGGSCPANVNDQQFKNHHALYDKYLPDGTIWFVPRSCQDQWNMWFKDYIDDFLLEIVRAFSVNDIIDVNKVFLTGYSAGGDGIYRLAPRLADYLAGAAMMAGHPGGVNLMNLRNIAFSIQCGQKDDEYNRHYESVKYIRMLNQLAHNYGGFKHQSQVHIAMPHFMKSQDGKVFNWLLNHTRNPYPNTILYKESQTCKRLNFYYIRIGQQKIGSSDEQVVVIKQGNKFRILSNRTITVLVNRLMINQNQPVTIVHNGTITMQRPLVFKADIAQKTFFERMDPYYTFEDQFVSEPPSSINIKTAVCNQFDLDLQQKQAQFQKSLPVKVQDLPSNFNKSYQPLVKRSKAHTNQREDHQYQFVENFGQGQGINQQNEIEVVNYYTQNQGSQPNQWPQEENMQYQNQNQYSNQNQYGNQNQYSNQNPQMQKVARQKQQLQTVNPYRQQDGTKSKQPIRCADECCNIF